MASHVYRRTAGSSRDGVSVRDSGSEGKSDGWSIFSGFSLDDTSVVAAVNLPMVPRISQSDHTRLDVPLAYERSNLDIDQSTKPPGNPDVQEGRAFTIPDSGYGTASKAGTLSYQPPPDQGTDYSDIASVITDNLSLDLPRDTGKAYVDAFVARILEATGPLSADKMLETQLIEMLPHLLRSFALRVAFAEQTIDGRAVGVFTRQYRE